MLSKNKIKYLHSLNTKKSRDVEGVFVAEGPKVVGDIFASHPSNLTLLVATSEWLNGDGKKVSASANCEIVEVTTEELAKASFLCHPQQVLGVFKKLKTPVNTTMLTSKLTIALDGVQDPGNLGTIIRIADWFGIENVICSLHTADMYNPKVLRATEGMIFHINIIVRDLPSLITELKKDNYKIYGTKVDGGINVKDISLKRKYALVIGNEGNGVSEEVNNLCDEYLYIKMNKEVESLNAGVATSILLYEMDDKYDIN